MTPIEMALATSSARFTDSWPLTSASASVSAAQMRHGLPETVAAIALAVAGAVAGLYPARKAAMLQPVDALRQE